MREVELETTSAAETERIASALAGALEPGDVVLIEGEVGTGKTTFVRGAAHALGVEGNVASPSFTIGRRHLGRVPVSHLDLFRLESFESEDPSLLDDYLDRDTIVFVEWPKEGASALGLPSERDAIVVRLSHLGDDRRRVRLSGSPRALAGILP